MAWLWGQAALAVPVLSISVDGAPAVSLEPDQFCDGGAPETCFGFGSVGDLLLSSFELSADGSAFVSGSIDFYNSSFTDTLAVEATILFPTTGSFAAASGELGTGVVTSVFGGGILDLSIDAFIDDPATSVLSISEAAPGIPFSVCDDLLADVSCQDSILSLTAGPSALGSIDILSAIGVTLSFDLTPDTSATVGFDPFEAFGGGSFFTIAPVPVPAAIWFFGSALGLLGWMRRR